MLHLYISRTHESLSWLSSMTVPCRITVFDQGDTPFEAPLPPDACILPAPEGLGMAGLMLALLSDRLPDASPKDFAVFAPADPFQHSPAFLELLQTTERWGDVQPLSIYGGNACETPPSRAIERDVRDWVGALPVRPERYSLTTLQPLSHHDAALHQQAQDWRTRHRLPEGESLVAAFLDQCGLDALAEQAREADIGVCAQGPVWGMRHSLLAEMHAHLHRDVERLATLLDTDPFTQTLLDHVWLHLAGLPFVSLAPLERPAPAMSALDESMALVVASIDAVLAQSEPSVRYSLPKRVQPAAAPAADEPNAVDALVQEACLALQRGDGRAAVAPARRALLLQPSSGHALHTLATSLSQAGEPGEAIRLLDSLTRDEAFRDYRAQHPERLARAHQQLLELMAGARPVSVDLSLDL